MVKTKAISLYYDKPMSLGLAEVWAMASKSEPNTARFMLRFTDGGYACSCPAGTKTPLSKTPCTHIRQVRKAEAGQAAIKRKNSIRVMKRGK